MQSALSLELKKYLRYVGVNRRRLIYLIQKFNRWSIESAISEQGHWDMLEKLRSIEPDISKQESSEREAFNEYNEYCELKKRGMHAFQCGMMLRALKDNDKTCISVVDIGDSAGTHMLYLEKLVKGRFIIDAIGVNLDPKAIEKIRARGQKALLCRAERLDFGGKGVDLFTSFQMVEHLHNPSIFFRKLAKRSPCGRMLITVPYRRLSRVGLYSVRNDYRDRISAEEEHIFELSPEDWTLLMRHSGWRVVFSRIYYQYPRNWPVISFLMRKYWEKSDHEGFWGAILEKDTSISDKYTDWEE